MMTKRFLFFLLVAILAVQAAQNNRGQLQQRHSQARNNHLPQLLHGHFVEESEPSLGVLRETTVSEQLQKSIKDLITILRPFGASQLTENSALIILLLLQAFAHGRHVSTADSQYIHFHSYSNFCLWLLHRGIVGLNDTERNWGIALVLSIVGSLISLTSQDPLLSISTLIIIALSAIRLL